ncbi:MAG: DUF6036 family nucleotidyltransferase [bacterium]
MNREQFEHTIRAAGAVLGVSDILVIGSQALHASVAGSLPDEASRSVEVDVAVFEDTNSRGADLIDGSIGEASMFHSTFGYYAHGVAETTAVLPTRWRERLVRFETPATSGVTAWCLEPHDLWISKVIAGRDKDLEFCSALLRIRIVEREELSRRLVSVDSMDDRLRTLVQARIDRP